MRYIEGAGQFLRETGLLGEINRLVLHPRGLALVVVEVTAGETVVSTLADVLATTEDPEGIHFGPDMVKEIAERLRAAEERGQVKRVTAERAALFPRDGVEPRPAP